MKLFTFESMVRGVNIGQKEKDGKKYYVGDVLLEVDNIWENEVTGDTGGKIELVPFRAFGRVAETAMMCEVGDQVLVKFRLGAYTNPKTNTVYGNINLASIKRIEAKVGETHEEPTDGPPF